MIHSAALRVVDNTGSGNDDKKGGETEGDAEAEVQPAKGGDG